MAISRIVSTGVLTVHGGIALVLGLVFFYLSAAMTNPLFEVLAVVTALVLATAALLLAAIADWFAAFSAGMKSAHRIIFYLLAGIAFALAGLLIGYSSAIYMQWLVGFAALHALVFGTSIITFAFTSQDDTPERIAMAIFGMCSVVFSGALAAWIPYLNDKSAIALLGGYLFFVGIKLIYLALNSRRKRALEGSPVLLPRRAVS